MRRLLGMFVLDRDAYEAVYAPRAAEEIGWRVALAAPPQTRESIADRPGLLGDVEVLFSGWGAPTMDAAFLAAAPRLEAVFYGAGSTSGWCTRAVWDRGITVTTAAVANAVPVAEYTVATTLFSLKQGWRLARPEVRRQGFRVRDDVPGNYGSTVGLVGMGAVGRAVVRMLAPFHLRVVTYDPFLSDGDASMLGVARVGLEELFARSDVVSLHAADGAATRGMVTGDLVRSMLAGAALINTARGALVDHDRLAEALQARPDLQAVLDVTDPEPLGADSPLLSLPNVVLTPHIAGSQGRECRRLGQYMVDELDRYLSGRPLHWRVPAEKSNGVGQPRRPALVAQGR